MVNTIALGPRKLISTGNHSACDGDVPWLVRLTGNRPEDTCLGGCLTERQDRRLVSRSQTRPRLLLVGGRGSGEVPLISWFFRPLHSMGHKDIKISA